MLRRLALLAGFALAAPALASDYVLLCYPGICPASDGSQQPCGTAVQRVHWADLAPYNPPAGMMSLVDDGRPIYTPANALFSATTGHRQLVPVVRGLDMQKTVEQLVPFTATGIEGNPSKFFPIQLYLTNCTASAAGAIGGIYLASGRKSGTELTSPSQSYASLTNSERILSLSFARIPQQLPSPTTLYFALTAGSTAAAKCDLYLEYVGM
jgi:hypothetical protein